MAGSRQDRIDEARKHLDDVIDQMAAADRDIRDRIKSAIQNIVEASFIFGVPAKAFSFSGNQALEKEVDRLLAEYGDSIEQVIVDRSLLAKAVSEQKNRDKMENALLIAFLGRALVEETMRQRIDRYSVQLKSQIEGYIAIGAASGWSRAKITSEYMMWANNPLMNPALQKAFRDIGYRAPIIVARGITYGTGNYNSVSSNLKRLEQDTIRDAYCYADSTLWQRNPDIVAWAHYRGSNYPCSTCDADVGIPKPISEPFYQLHPNCVCFAIPIYRWEL